MNSFKKYSKYYDNLYQDKDYQYETEYLINLIKKFNIKSKTILDLGCGTGKHAKLLSKNGYLTTGIDKSKEMIEIAKSHSNNDYFVGDITTFQLSKKFDVALSIFHVFSYITTNKQLKQAFLNVNKHLKDNGIFILDVWYTPAVIAQIPEHRTKTFENEELLILRSATPIINTQKNLIDVVYRLSITKKQNSKVDRFKETHRVRHFTSQEIAAFSKLAGFTIINSEEILTANPPSIKTWGVCYILKKI